MDGMREEAGSGADAARVRALEERFGALAPRLAREGPLALAWKLNFLANFFTGPLYRETEARHGLTRAGFVILLCLERAPGLMARDVARVTGLPKNSISRAVGELERRGLVARRRDAEDRRGLRLKATPEGLALLGAAMPLVEARQAAMAATLTPAERAALDALLMRLVAGLPDWVDRVDGDGA